MSKLDPAQVHRMFDYKDGVLYWNTSPANCAPDGAVAGGLHKQSGRVVITIQGQKFLRARLVWAWHHREWPNVVRHRNDNLQDDRIDNLHNTTTAQVNAARRMASSSDRLPGVSRKSGRGWQAQIDSEYLGTFETQEEAHAAFLQAYEQQHGTTAPYTLTGGVNMSIGCASNTSPPPPFFIANGISPANIQGAGE